MTVPEDAEADMLSIGAHCSHPECNQLDFLPFRCSGCSHIFCGEHRSVTAHDCPHAAAAEVQIIVCPACARAIKLEDPNEDPNVAYERHSRTACDPSNYARVHKKRKCPVKGCRERLTSTNSLTCKDCGASVCLRHRLGEDHACPGPRPPPATGLRATLGGFFSSSSSSSKQAGRGTNAGTGVNARPAAAAAAAGGPSRLASAKSKVAAAARSASGSLQAQLQEYRTAHKNKTGSNTSTTAAAAASTVGSAAPERCGQCGQRFATVQALIDHAAAAHSDGWASGGGLDARPAAGAGGLERCPTCGAGFDDPVALVRHVETAHRTNAVSEVCVLL